jgi:hypothetical protein
MFSYLNALIRVEKFEKLKVCHRRSALAADMYKLFSQSRDFGFKDKITH